MSVRQKTSWNFSTYAELEAAGYTLVGGGRCAAKCVIKVLWWITPNGKWMLINAYGLKPHWFTCKGAKTSRPAANKKAEIEA